MNNPSPASAVGQVLRHGGSIRYLAGFTLDRVAIWVATVTAIILVYQLTESVPLAAAVMLVPILGRATVVVIARAVSVAESVVLLAAILRIGAVAGLILFQNQGDVWWVLILLGIVGVASGIVELSHASLLPRVGDRRQLPAFNRAVGRCEQISAVAGPVVSALLILVLDHRTAFAIAAAALYCSLLLLRRLLAEHRLEVATGIEPSWGDNPFTVEMRALPAEVKMVMTGLVAIAALSVIIRVALLDLVIGNIGYSGAAYALMLAVVGVGALLGPMPVDRLLGHFPVGLILSGGVFAIAGVVAIVGLGSPLLIVVPAMFAIGFTIVTLDSAAAVSVRRAVPERNARDVSRSLAQALLLGQSAALVVVIAVSSAWNSTAAAIGISVLCAVAVGVHFLQAGRVETLQAAQRSDADRGTPEESAAG